jgi:tRNA pseudouridine13 synthase
MPRAHGGAAGSAHLRARPEHFKVVEELGFEPDGEGGHLLLRVVKTGANTHWVARRLAQRARVADHDVGFSGLKDRHAVVSQHFTVPAGRADDWIGFAGDGFRVEAVARTRRKLRRGVHRANRFELLLTELATDPDLLRERLGRLERYGAPNYFGPQRFGRDGANLQLAERCFAPAPARIGRAQRSFALSAARAAIFNAVLAERVRLGTWDRFVVGDLANLAGTRSTFPVAALDHELERRRQEFDVHPTGPLWGRDGTTTQSEPALLERRIAQAHVSLSGGLERARLEPERRALRVRVEELEWSLTEGGLRLCFRLGRGAYATAVVNELVDVAAGDLGEDE